MGEFVGRSDDAPLEIVHAVLDRAEAEIQDIGRGRRVFPFNRVRVHVVAAAGDEGPRARFAAVVDGPPSLADRLSRTAAFGGLRGRQPRDGPSRSYAGAGIGWADSDFHVEFDRVDRAAAAPFVT